MPKGFVYILISPNSNYVKIGGTERPINERLRGINGTANYGDHGPWELSDFLHVKDWRLVEASVHKHFGSKRVRDVDGTRELFDVRALEARSQLRQTKSELRVDHVRTRQIFEHPELSHYLHRLFQVAGLYGHLDIQGAWTLSLMTATTGGRWFTINIGPHEVAFATRKVIGGKVSHYVVLDRLILEYPQTIIWIGKNGGEVQTATYLGAERAVAISFYDDFAGAERVFKLPGIRRAMAAYWSDRLADLRERNAKSTFARFHSYDAVSELMNYKRSADEALGAYRARL